MRRTAREAEQLRHERPVERKARRGDRGGSHRAEVDHLPGLQQPPGVAQQRLDQRAEIVAEGRRLGRLAVGVGEDERAPLERARSIRVSTTSSSRLARASSRSRRAELEQGVVDVVARAAGVQAAGDVGLDRFAAARVDHEEEQVLVLAGVGLRPGPLARSLSISAKAFRMAATSVGVEQSLSASMTPCAR